MASIIKVDQLQSDTGQVNVASNIKSTSGATTVYTANTLGMSIGTSRMNGPGAGGKSLTVWGDGSSIGSRGNLELGNPMPTPTAATNYGSIYYTADGYSGLNYGYSHVMGAIICSSSGSGGPNGYGGNIAFYTKSDNVGAGNFYQRASFDHNGTLNLNYGQIAFPAAQNASADPNTLDDYEEGTWTPVIGGTGGATGQSYNTQNGYYTKIGNMCHLTGYVHLATKGTFVGSYCCITGLPFAGVGSDWQISVGYYGGLANSKVYVGGYTSGTLIVFSGKSAASTELAVSAFGASDIQNGTFIAFTVSYRTA